MVSEDTAVKTPFVSTFVSTRLFNVHWTIQLRCLVSSLRSETILNTFLIKNSKP